jgi:hypothetical protein
MSKNKKVKYLPGIGLVRTAEESKILPDCGEKQSCSVCEKAAECKQKKVESDAKDIREKYPEIAKMTVAEVVATNLFVIGLRKAIANYNRLTKVAGVYYAYQYLKQNNTLEPENFRKEYIACMDKESKMPAIKRSIVLAIGNDAYRRTVKQMMDNYDAIQNGEATKNLEKLSL